MKVSGWVSVVAVVVGGVLAGVVGCERADSGSSSTSTDLTVTPNAIVISAAVPTNLAFSVTGGRSAYTWTVNSPALGTIVGAGATAIYTSTTNAGLNIITVTDGNTNSVAATVTQN